MSMFSMQAYSRPSSFRYPLAVAGIALALLMGAPLQAADEGALTAEKRALIDELLALTATDVSNTMMSFYL